MGLYLSISTRGSELDRGLEWVCICQFQQGGQSLTDRGIEWGCICQFQQAGQSLTDRGLEWGFICQFQQGGQSLTEALSGAVVVNFNKGVRA